MSRYVVGIMMIWRGKLGLCILPLLTSCTNFSHHVAAPVTELSAIETASNGIHVVQSGETLYEIAWKYGRDYRSLAAANHIYPPYIIRPGQKLTLKKYADTTSAQKSMLSTSKNHVAPKASAQRPKPIAPEVAKSKITGATVTHQARPKPNFSNEKLPSGSFNNQWDWPVKGKIINVFSVHGLTPNKGIDISGVMGAPVKSAAKGKVVYSGSGLRGYGQLLIIKHNETYLSAYAHNSRLLVKEGDSVEKGQVIAHMGQSEAQSVRLHFEIRKNGQPINPMLLLPRLTA